MIGGLRVKANSDLMPCASMTRSRKTPAWRPVALPKAPQMKGTFDAFAHGLRHSLVCALVRPFATGRLPTGIRRERRAALVLHSRHYLVRTAAKPVYGYKHGAPPKGSTYSHPVLA